MISIVRLVLCVMVPPRHDPFLICRHNPAIRMPLTRLRARIRHFFIHPGHIRYLRHARGLGEQLVVALIGDGKTSMPFNNKTGRRPQPASIADALLLLKANELKAAIEALKPEVLFWEMSSKIT